MPKSPKPVKKVFSQLRFTCGAPSFLNDPVYCTTRLLSSMGAVKRKTRKKGQERTCVTRCGLRLLLVVDSNVGDRLPGRADRFERQHQNLSVCGNFAPCSTNNFPVLLGVRLDPPAIDASHRDSV